MNALATPAGVSQNRAAVVWPIELLTEQLGALWPGLCVEVLAEADSTNTRLIERARAGDTAPCLLVAERQTAGRGRLGRSWWSDLSADQSADTSAHTNADASADKGARQGVGTAADTAAGAAAGPASLTFSIGLPFAPRAPTGWSGLSLAVGVALAESLHPGVRLKWPNDLWLQAPSKAGRALGRKLGGVLIETLAPTAGDTRHAVIGIGINLAAPGPQAGIGQPVAGWREVAPEATAAALLGRVAPAVVRALAHFEREGFTAFASRFAARDALAGRPVRTLSALSVAGVADGVDARGALRVQTPEGLRLIDSGEIENAEVSVRPC